MNRESNNLIRLFNELAAPFLMIILFFKNIFIHIFDLFNLSWKSTKSVFVMDIMLSSFFSVFFVLSMFNTYYLFYDFIEHSLTKEIFFNLIVVFSICFVGWGFSTISSIKQSILSSEEKQLKNHFLFGLRYIKFFIRYSLMIVFLISFVILICLIGGFIPHGGQTFLSFFLSPVFFVGLLLFVTIFSLIIGSIFYGSYINSDYYNSTSSFFNQTISMYKMVITKIVDLISITLPAIISSLTLTIIPFLITLIVITDFIKKPTAGFFKDGITFPGLYVSSYDDDNSKQRSFNFLKSKDFHNRYPKESTVAMKQKIVSQTVFEYNENRNDYERSLDMINAIKSLGFSSPGRQLDSLDSFVENNPTQLKYEGILIDNLRLAIENEIFQDLIKLDLKLIQNHFIDEFTHFDEKWSFDSFGELQLISEDDFIGEKIVIRNDSILFYESDFVTTQISDSEVHALNYASKIDENLKYVGVKDFFVFTMLTDIFLIFSDAAILAFPLMFMFASLASISFDVFHYRFKSTFLVKAIVLVIIFSLFIFGFYKVL